MHIAQIGTGRVGRPTAYTLMCSQLADKLTVCDTKPGLAAAFAEELKHVTASTGTKVEIGHCMKDEDVTNADIILISAGQPRSPGVKMTRRDLAVQNGKIIREISKATAPNNPKAKYIVITNPVDAMAMVCKKYTKADFVISTGTNLESLRYRSKIAQSLRTPVSEVKGWVGGEHGDAAFPLWSMTTISNSPIEDYASSKAIPLPKLEITTYVRVVSKQIVDNIGGTEFGPAASFRDIVRAIINDTGEILPIATPTKFPDIPEPVMVGLPTHVGAQITTPLYSNLTAEEQKTIDEAAKAIYDTYITSIENIK